MVYKFNILILSNRDSLDVSQQISETTVFAAVHVLIANLGSSDSDFAIARRDLENVFPTATAETTLSDLSPGAQRLLHGADLLIVASPSECSGDDLMLRRIEAALRVGKMLGIPTATAGACGLEDTALGSKVESTRLLHPNFLAAHSGAFEPSPLEANTVGVIVESPTAGEANMVSHLSRATLATLAESCSAQGARVRVFSTGEPTEHQFLSDLRRQLPSDSAVQVTPVETPQQFVDELTSCGSVLTSRFSIAALAAGFGVSVGGYGKNPHLAELLRTEQFSDYYFAIDRPHELEKSAVNLAQALVGALTKKRQIWQSSMFNSYLSLFAQVRPVLRPLAEMPPYSLEEYTNHARGVSSVDPYYQARQKSRWERALSASTRVRTAESPVAHTARLGV